MLLVISFFIIASEIVCLVITFQRERFRMFRYYTILSNCMTLVSTALILPVGAASFAAALRYLSVCMMTMTFLVVVFVLVPMTKDVKGMLFHGTELFYHTVNPILTVLSYVLWEAHSRAWLLPVGVTLVYGFLMMYLNHIGVADGPYPFLKVNDQSKGATAAWICALFALIGGIAWAYSRLA